MAAQMGTATGMAYLYGPSAADAGVALPKLPTLFKRVDRYSRCVGPALPDGSNCSASWQVGGPRNDDATNDQALAGGYSTNQAVVAFTPDNATVRPASAISR